MAEEERQARRLAAWTALPLPQRLQAASLPFVHLPLCSGGKGRPARLYPRTVEVVRHEFEAAGET
jgi:hypothetical protein